MKHPILLLLACFIADTAFANPVYRWVDDRGVTNYTDDQSSIPAEHKVEVTSGAELGYISFDPPVAVLPSTREKTHERRVPRRGADPCADKKSQLEARKSWLRERFAEQAKMGAPNPRAYIPNMMGVYCESHPTDSQCKLGDPPTSFHPDELSIDVQKTPEDRDAHVIRLKRELDTCRGGHPG